MPKIKQLSPHEAQKIAAGEVVERPANIVKELVENSIDAGATRINMYVEDGGKKLIRIVDNGCGMDTTDAQLCFDRHATSKITRVDELESIQTFGFRGEALASIAAVSQITMLTKEEAALEGTHVVTQTNAITQVNAAACATGTDISINNLFFNVPARKKFLKSTQTEWRAIQLLFNAFCFDYPHIHFTLFSEGKQIHNCPVVTDIKNRALQLFEPVAHKHLLNISVDTEIFIKGVISDHQHYRYDRSSIYFFVNNRWVKNHHLSSALIKGYANVIPNGRYPIGAITITVPAHEVDINIHPRKEEVKFLHPRRVEQALQNAVKAALENNLSTHLKKDVSFKDTEPLTHSTQSDFNPFNFDSFLELPAKKPISQSSIPRARQLQPISSSFQWAPNRNEVKIGLKGYPRALKDVLQQVQDERERIQSKYIENSTQHYSGDLTNHQIPFIKEIAQINSSSTGPALRSLGEGRVIGQYNTTYLLVEHKDGLFLVDQHAAHERILYELFSQRFDEVATIQLLFPHIITLSPQDIEIIVPHLTIFTEHGIIIEQCASDQLIVQSIPVHLKEQSLNDIVQEVISWITECASLDEIAFKKTIHHKLQAQMACKAAVKAGDVLTQEKMEQLLRDLEKTNNRFSCPHGRPTGWLLSLTDIEKKFRRRL